MTPHLIPCARRNASGTAPPCLEPPDMERLMAIAANKYDIEIMGPLPGH
jgi:hypothetical protein